MKLSIDTYVICGDMELGKLIDVSKSNGYVAIEFRGESGQKHGVEPEIGKAQRQAIKRQMADAGMATSCISTSVRYDSPDRAERAKNIDRAKQFAELAADIGCGRIRTFGNDFPKGVEKEEVIKYVGESLREVAEFSADHNVDVLLEMHGEFYYWEHCLNAVKIADHPNVAINYNSDKRDLVDGSVAQTYYYVAGQLRHVHMHDLADPTFPYKELFQLLKNDGYDNYMSLELGYKGGDSETVMKLYAALYRELMNQVR
ncbi:sugar phosphate isomerase/epimerase family protein [Candidatus Poribacteria bacterium]